MPTTLNTNQVIDHLFLLTLLSSPRDDRSKLLDRFMATVHGQPDKEKTYVVEVRVNGIELDFGDFTDKVRAQLDELVMGAARRLLDEQFADRFRAITHTIDDAQRRAEDLCNALEAEARKAWGMPPGQDQDD